MAPLVETKPCYICNDKRRIADVDAAVTPTSPQADSDTLKHTLMQALSHGHVEDMATEVNEESRLSSGVCVVMLNSGRDGGLQAVSDRVLVDPVVICRRCAGLLKDYEHHEKTAARYAEKLRGFLTRQLEVEEVLAPGSKPETPLKKTMARHDDERKGIIEAYKAFKKCGMADTKRRGQKRKNHPASQGVTGKGEEDDYEDAIVEGGQREGNDSEEMQLEGTSRQSKRIQRRREDGLVIRWGDAMYENFYDDAQPVDDYIVHPSPNALPRGRPCVRRGRGRRITSVVKSVSAASTEGEIGFKSQCPFCLKYYVPMSSRLHGCTSYKNKLRCHTCNIFFTSHVRLERHLEVIHLKPAQHTCPIKDCDFNCIAESTFTIHKHFHALESLAVGDGKDTALVEEEIQEETVQSEEMMEEDEEAEVLTSPRIADRVSFLLDEKSFLSDGHPLNITTDTVSKGTQDDCKVLRFQNREKTIGNPSGLGSKLETIILSPNKGKNLSIIQCPVCDITLTSTKKYQDHIRDVHQLQVSSKMVGEDGSLKESRKGLGSETLTKIVKYCGIKKNSKSALKGLV